jgi:quinol monooxygenase YgiN
MPSKTPVLMLVKYMPKPGSEERLLELVRQHWPTLRQLRMATSSPAQLFRAVDKRTGRTTVIEMFEWTDDTSSETAHQTPEVMAVWEPMGPLLESMELARLERL